MVAELIAEGMTPEEVVDLLVNEHGLASTDAIVMVETALGGPGDNIVDDEGDENLTAAFDESKIVRHPKGTHVSGKVGGGRFADKPAAPGGKPSAKTDEQARGEKSKGHLLFADKWEFLIGPDGDLYRASIAAPVMSTNGIRGGARWEAPAWQIPRLQEQGLYPFDQQTLDLDVPAVEFDADALVGTSLDDGGTGTEMLFAADGTWEPKRVAAVHAPVTEFFTSDMVSQDEPVALFSAGGSGSGKSSVIQSIEGAIPEDAVVVNPDLVKEMIPEYDALVKVGDERAAPFVHEESSHISKQVLARAVEHKANVYLDGVGDSEAGQAGKPGKFLGKILTAEKAGYRPRVIVVDAPITKATQNAIARAKRSGRAVRLNDLVQLHKGVSRVFPEWSAHVKDWEVYANDGEFGEHRRIAYRENGGDPVIVDADRFQQFLDKGKD